MRLLIQRVREARVTVDGRVVGEIGPGLAVLAGFGGADASDLPRGRLWSALVEKMLLLRVFPDASGKMNLGLADFGGEILLVSQFTLPRRRRWPNRCSTPLFGMWKPACPAACSAASLLLTWT